MSGPYPTFPALRRAVAVLLGVALASATAWAAGGSTEPGAGAPGGPEEVVRLSATTVPATGTHAVDLSVTRFGRYAITATSPQGTAVQLVDRMAGPGETRGEPGVANGRVDAFLERGEWRVRAISDRAGTGEARIEARPFVEVGGARPPLLPDEARVSTTLADLEQRSWWVHIDADEDFAVELAGRSLADVRLWKDGQWLDPATPTCEEIAPDPSRPLRRCALGTRLGAGLWQLVAYGGPAVAWSVTSPDQPLHVRRGMPMLAEAGRLSGTIGPFGAERWLVPGKATAFRLELPTATDAAVSVRPFDASDPFRRDGTVGRIQKESLPPVADVSVAAGSEGKVVTVSGASGQAFTLQHFPRSPRHLDVRGSGLHLLTSLHLGDPADRPDVTGVLVESRSGYAPIATALLPLAPDRPYRRKFNLLGTTTLAFDVAADDSYQVAVAAKGVKWRWEPYLVEKPKGYAAPPLREGPGETELARGRWALTLVPDTGGVVEVVVRADPLQEVTPSQPRSNVQLLAVLEAGKAYRLWLNDEEGAAAGYVVRALPADLDIPLPLTVGAGESVTLPVLVPADGTLVADGLELTLDGGAPAARHRVVPGTHQLTVRNGGNAVVQASVTVERDDRGPRAPLPALPDTAVTTPPALPMLTTSAPRSLDLARDASATYRLDVPEPGLYRLESTGLLATAGAVRTRTRPVLASGAVNGVGRNFLLQTYLREGDYQVTVGAQGASEGHLGLRVAATPLRDGGALRTGVPARASVPAGAGVAYQFEVAEAGTYVLRAFGMGRLFRVRLEDADGWPVVAPEVDGDLRLALDPGAYRLVVLPEAVDTTRITTFDRVPDPITRTGHGPFPLALDEAAEHVWWESPEGAPRAPDVWRFVLDAPADVTITASGEMTGELVAERPARSDAAPARLVHGRPWTGRLEPGAWRLELVNARRNSGVRYAVRVSPRELVPGLAREVEVPASVPVSVGSARLHELASMGLVDVSARLFDAAGRLVARSDDRPDDWNFRVLERLEPGAYTLRVEPVGEARGRTVLAMAQVEETDEPPLALGEARTVTPEAGVLRVPLAATGEGILVASARSAENVGIAVERRTEAGWRTLGEDAGTEARVLVRAGAAPAELRLRVTSLDGRGLPASVRIDRVEPRVVSEAAISRGVTAPVAAGRGIAAVVVERASGGAIELPARLGTSWCPAEGASCMPVPDTLLAPAEERVWLVAEGDGRSASFQGSRWSLDAAPGRVTVPAGGSAMLDARAAPGPLLVFAEAEAGDPGLTFGTAARVPLGESDGAPGRAVAAHLGEEGGKAAAPTVRVHAASAVDGSLEVELRRVAFPAPEVGRLLGAEDAAGGMPAAGAAGGPLAAGGAWRAPLTGDPASVRLVLAEGLVAVLARGGAPVETVWAADGARDVTVETTADALWVLNPGARAASWSATSTPRAGAPRILRAGADPLERVAGVAGRVRVDVTGAQGDVLSVRGAATEARVWLEDGRVLRGRDLPVSGAGRVEIVHGPGPWVAWVAPMEGDAAAAAALWGRVEPDGKPRTVQGPATVPLEGAATAFRVGAPKGVLRVRADQPVVARVDLGAAGVRVLLALDGIVEVPVHAPARADVTLRAFAGATLRGSASVDVRAAEPLAEGLAAESLLGAGEARAYAFTLDGARPIGVGLRTASPDVRATLYGPDGTPIGEGVVQMPSLAAGSYLLVVSLGADAAPASVRPALVGLVPPDTGPPPEVIRSYLVAAGLLPPDAPPAEEE